MAQAKAKAELVKKQVTSRIPVLSSADSTPRHQNVEYTVVAEYADGRSQPVGTVSDFADVDSLKSGARVQAAQSGAVLKGFRTFERDHDSHRRDDNGNPNHMVESEVS